ncbi:GtrA family protein [Pseudobacillus wudalianchiensis]|uniref:Polysaccharide biosynthesis protein n=1 Tax=Pseudobacillus wudalianchiensis TaxID=1743143 RepID=A0A1B9AMZ0_9BACI|nr:GtrA family protein [Bacillus wudalianchiensis]OCA85166.1 polysaccharide biosynthesis protein [Bacillus wudalianchiensis]
MRRTSQEFIRFVIIGGINTFNYYAVYLLLHMLLGWLYMPSHVIAFLVSFIISFFLNSYFTFKVKPTLAKFLKFPLSQVVNFTVSSLFMYVFIEYFQINSMITPILAVFVALPATFVVTSKIMKKESVSA